MTRPPPQDRGYPLLASLIARDIKTWQARVARAEEVMADARSPLKGAGYGTITVNSDGGSSPPPGVTFTRQGDLQVDGAQATRQLKELHNRLNTIDREARGVSAILDEWAPNPIHSEHTIWCENHLRYGQHVTRADDGSTNCGWCCNVHRAYKTWPNRQLIDMHDRGQRISETKYQQLLGKGTAA